MPKTNDNTGATYAGQEGIVEHADGSLSELDPSRNVDGSPVDGFQSDEDETPDEEPEQPQPERSKQRTNAPKK